MEAPYLETIRLNPSKYILNADKVTIHPDGTVEDGDDVTYTLSQTTHYQRILGVEISHHPNFIIRNLWWFGWKFLIGWMDLSRVTTVCNYGLSTNLHTMDDLKRGVSLFEKYPNTVQGIRSIRRSDHLQFLIAQGFRPVLSRQVWISNLLKPPETQPFGLQHQSSSRGPKRLRRDYRFLHLLLNKGYRVESFRAQPKIDHRELTIDELTDDHHLGFKSCYDHLYLKKYSQINPQFTLSWFRLFVQSPNTSLIWIRHPEGRICGVIGYYVRGDEMTAPIFGYLEQDLHIPEVHFTMYAALSSILAQENQRLGKIGNWSGGVPNFKRNRGAVPWWEFTMVRWAGGSWRQRFSWWMLSKYTQLFLTPYENSCTNLNN